MNRQMTDEQLDRVFKQFLAARNEEIVAAALPARLAAAHVRGRATSQAHLMVRPAVAILLMLGVLIVALLAAEITGAGPFHRPKALPGNGLITFGLGDLTQRPYETVHVILPDGSGERVIGPGIGQTFSADGRVLAYWAGPWPGQVLTVADPDGSSPRGIPGIDGGFDVALSPDGSRIAWRRIVGKSTSPTSGGGGSGWDVTELWVSPLSGGPGMRIAAADLAPDGFLSHPVWSPDGASLAFAVNTIVVDGDNSGSYRSSIYIASADGSGLRRLTGRPGSDSVEISWSPDSRFLIFTGLPDGTAIPSFPPPGQDPNDFFRPDDIFVIGADGADERDLTNTSGREFAPRWSPDGSRIAWIDAQQHRLNVLRLDGASPIGDPTVGPLVRDEYVWSPDGQRVAFYWYEFPADGISGGQIIDVAIESIAVAHPKESPTVILAAQHLVRGLSWQPLPSALPSR